jgi:hypothetical protein
VAFPLKFIVNLDAKELSLLNRRYNLLIKVNYRCRSSTGVGKVDKFTLFRGKLYSLYISLLATCLLSSFKVVVGCLYIFTKCKEVKVVGKANCNKVSVVLELGIEAYSIEEEENRGEWRPL